MDIFVSYSKKDWSRVSRLVAVLEAQGLSVWWDKDINAGSDFRDVIDQEIRAARAMVVAWSANANSSKWVRDEADEGVRRGILVPILLEQILPPMGFRSIQAADLTGWQGESDAPALTQLLADLTLLLKEGPPKEPTQADASAAAPPRVRTTGANRLKPTWFALGGALVLLVGWLLVRPSKPSEQVNQTSTAAHASRAGEAVTAAESAAPAAIPALASAEPPPSDYFVLPALGRQPDSSLRLVKTQEKRNAITDDADWWVANGLTRTTYTVPNPFRQQVGDLPPFVPRELQGLRVVKATRGPPVMAIYGTNFSEGKYLLALDPLGKKAPFGVDFSLYEWPRSFQRSEKEFVQMATMWAQVEGDTLYVAHAHRTYAKSSDGYNAYITAIDVPSSRILWRSQPLVSNADNFIVKNDAIVAGYGFTHEKDFLYVLNKADGRVVQQVAVKSGPSNLVEKDGRLLVRTYDTDYVFQYTTAPP